MLIRWNKHLYVNYFYFFVHSCVQRLWLSYCSPIHNTCFYYSRDKLLLLNQFCSSYGRVICRKIELWQAFRPHSYEMWRRKFIQSSLQRGITGFWIKYLHSLFCKGRLVYFLGSVAQVTCKNLLRTRTEQVLEIEWSNITFHFRTFPKGLHTDMLSIGNFRKLFHWVISTVLLTRWAPLVC